MYTAASSGVRPCTRRDVVVLVVVIDILVVLLDVVALVLVVVTDVVLVDVVLDVVVVVVEFT